MKINKIADLYGIYDVGFKKKSFELCVAKFSQYKETKFISMLE